MIKTEWRVVTPLVSLPINEFDLSYADDAGDEEDDDDGNVTL